MTASKLHSALTAAFLGAASVASTALVMVSPAQAQATVSPRVGAALTEARSLANAKNYKGALAKIAEAEAVPGRTADDNRIIAQMKQAVGVMSGDAALGGTAGLKAKFANDYNARKYKDVIAGGEALRKAGALDSASSQVVAQAYYLSGDFVGCQRYIRANFGMNAGDATLELLMRCAYETGDDATQRQALETLVSRGGKAEHWKGLLRLAERSRGLSDHNTLDINRMRLLTNNITTKDEYTLLAQLALQLGFAAEAKSVLEKGQAAKVLTDDRTTRLLKLATDQANASAAGQAKALAAAQAAPQGDDLVKVGENMIGQGKAKEAIGVIQAGLKKPLKDADNGQMRLGQAYLAAGQKADAQKAFSAVKGTTKNAEVAKLWALVARR
jgi:hypothetical protein